MRAFWAIAGGLILGAGLAWWLGQGQDGRVSPEARQRAEQARAAQAEDTVRPLYRWRDASGQLQITDTPPPHGQAYERLPLEPASGIVVDGGR